MDTVERRYFGNKVELRKAPDGKILGGGGFGAKYNVLSEDLGGFRERIVPGFFDDIVGGDIRILRDHVAGMILGRTKAGTAKIELREEGPYYSWDDPETTYSLDLQKSMERGDVTQSSFGFTVKEDSWEEVDGQLIRSLIKGRELFDFSPVTFPAYPDATVAKRSLDKYLEGKKSPEVPKKEIKQKSKTKIITKMNRIKELEDERMVLLDANDVALANLEDGQGNARSFTEDEQDEVDERMSRIAVIERELEVRKSQLERKNKIVTTEAQKAAGRASSAGVKTIPPEEKELGTFSLPKFLKGVSDRTLSGFEKEMAQEGNRSFKESGAQPQGGNSYLIPQSVLEARRKEYRAPMLSGTVASPGEAGKAVTEEIGSWIDALRANLGVVQAGADFQTGLVGNIKWPAENAIATGTWEGEVDAGAESTPTTTNVSMAPLRVGTYVDVSNQALIQTSPSVGARIERQMILAISTALDIAAINGSGTPPIPEGILQTSNIGSVALGTDGAAITWDAIVNLEREVDVDNALQGNLSYLTNAKAIASLKRVKKDAGSGIFLLDTLMGEGAATVNGHRVVNSNNVPSDLTKGMGTALSALIFGNFNDLIVGQWGGLEVLVDPYTQATTGTTRYVINSFNDVAVLRAVSFAAIVDIVTT